MKKIIFSGITALLLLTSLPLAAEQYAVTLRDTNIVDKPFRDAASVGSLASDTRIEVLQRKGGWYKVQGNDQTGWVRLTNLRLQKGRGKGNKGQGKGKGSAPGQQKKKVGSLDTLGEALSGGLFTTGSSNQVTSTTGIRGLDETDIGNAEPNPVALAQLKQYAVSNEQAQRFADKAKLRSSKLDYLAGDSANTGSGGLFNLFGGNNSGRDNNEEDTQ